MSATAMTPVSSAASPAGRRWLFSADDYWHLVETGFFKSARVELIGGEIVHMAAQTDWHLMGVDLLREQLELAFGANFWVRAQGTLNLSPLSVPDPDIAVVPGGRRTHRGRRVVPTTAVLVCEVSETTLWEDRTRKGSLYAAAGITDYWILNIVDSTLEVYRVPQPDTAREFGHGYADIVTLQAGDTVSPLAVPSGIIRVDDVLPR